jgi:hypothetical protein
MFHNFTILKILQMPFHSSRIFSRLPKPCSMTSEFPHVFLFLNIFKISQTLFRGFEIVSSTYDFGVLWSCSRISKFLKALKPRSVAHEFQLPRTRLHCSRISFPFLRLCSTPWEIWPCSTTLEFFKSHKPYSPAQESFPISSNLVTLLINFFEVSQASFHFFRIVF